MDKSDRIPCCVPFCKRTAARAKHPDAVEIICYLHWRIGSKVLRQRLSKLRKRKERCRSEVDFSRLEWLDWQVWERLKKQIIERAMGL